MSLYTFEEPPPNAFFNQRYVNGHFIKLIKSVILLSSPLSSGKTTSLAQLIIRHPGYRFIYLVPADRYSSVVQGELDRKIKQLDNSVSLNWQVFQPQISEQVDRLIVAVESLASLPAYHYDVVILDDLETLLSQFTSTNLGPKLEFCRGKFEQLIKQTCSVVGTDSFLSLRSYKVLSSLRDDVVVYKNQYRPQEKRIIRHKQAKKFYQALTKRLQQKKKLVVIWATTQLMHSFQQRNAKALGAIKYLAYDENSPTDVVETLIKVPQSWAKLDLVMLTPAWSVALDFNLVHFDQMFMYFTEEVATVRDMCQAGARIRQLKDNLIHSFLAT